MVPRVLVVPRVLERSLRDQRRSLLVWAGALVGIVAIYVAIYPSIKGNSSFNKLIDEMPKAYRALFSVSSSADFTSPAGYLNTELLSFMGPLLVLIYSIGAGSAAVAGEEYRHTLDLVLANPVSRARVVIEKFAAMAGGVALLMLVLWVSLVAEGAAAGMKVPVANSAAAVLQLGLLGIEFGAVALLAGCATGHLAFSRAVAGFAAAAAYLVNGLAQLAGWLRPIRPASPFYQFLGHDPLRNGVWLNALPAMAVTALILVAAAVATFRVRDVRQ